MANIRATSSNAKKLYCNIEIMKFRRRRNKRVRYKIRNDVNEPIQLTMCINKERKKSTSLETSSNFVSSHMLILIAEIIISHGKFLFQLFQPDR
jgi:hypothetical protein